MWYRERYTCPKCKGLLRYSKLENNKYVCKDCNNIVLDTEVEAPKNIYEMLLKKKARG